MHAGQRLVTDVAAASYVLLVPRSDDRPSLTEPIPLPESFLEARTRRLGPYRIYSDGKC